MKPLAIVMRPLSLIPRARRHGTSVLIGLGMLSSLLIVRPLFAQDKPADRSARRAAPSGSGTADARSLSERAAEFLAAARAKMDAEEQAKRSQPAYKEKVQRLVNDMARQRAKQIAAEQERAAQQLQLARDRQLKALYEQGEMLYRRGAYQDAIDILQKMAVLDPAHPLVRSAQHLITRAELKLLEQRAQVASAAKPGAGRDLMVSELTQLLTEKRIEQETVIKYARSAINEHQYDTAIALLYRVLNQDPGHREAQALLEQAQMAKLNHEARDLTEQIQLDEKRMANDVLKAEVLPSTPDRRKARPGSALPPPASDVMAKLSQPISFDFKEVAFTDVLDFLADAANVSIIPSPHLDLKQQRVSLHVDKLPLELALKYLMKAQDLAYRIDDGVILIATADEFANEPMETRVIFLKAGLSPFALETTAVEPNAALEMDSLKKLLEQNITQPAGSKLVIDERTGSLIVTNTSENLRRIERLVSQLDIAPTQVLIEARFMEVTLTDLQQLGVESVLTGNAALTKKGEANKTRSPGNQISTGSGFKFPALSRENEALNVTLQGVLTGTQFESVLHLLEERQKTKTLSAPRVTTLNNQMASIKVVDEFRYPTRYEVSLVQFDVNGDGDFDDAGETEFVNVPQDFQKRDVGILLNVTPSVGKDLKTITLVLAPEVSGFSQFRDLGGGVTVPEFTSSQLTTSVVMEDGQTVVLGGLMKDTNSEQLTKVPVLGDIPVIGNLFRQREETRTRKNLLIFVTARVLAPRGPTI